MNEQAQKVLSDLLSRAVNGVDTAVSFSQAQIPEVIHQLLMWKIVSNILLQLLGFLTVAVTIALWRFAKKERKEGAAWTKFRQDSSITSIPYDLLSSAAMLLPLSVGIFMVIAGFEWLKIWIAPKLFLLEYAASLIK